MLPLNSVLNIARNALHAHQAAVRVASHNVSNAQTEGYSRQRVNLAETTPDILPQGRMGTGVRVADITRARDSFLDEAVRRESGKEASFGLRQSVLSQIEDVLGEPSEIGLSAALDKFFSAWSGLADQPTSATARQIVVEVGHQVTNVFKTYGTRLDELTASTQLRLENTVTQINELAAQIASANKEIVRTGAVGGAANDLLDHRDRLIDQLSGLASVTAIPRENGAVSVIADGAMLVDAAQSRSLTVTSGSPPTIQMGTRTLSHPAEGSVMGELVSLMTAGAPDAVRIPDMRNRLDALAAGLVEQVNALHTSGFVGTTAGGNFFDPAGTTARTIDVVVAADAVAASDTSGETGNNRIALAMAALRGDPDENTGAAQYAAWTAVQNNIGGVAFTEHYRSTVTDLAVEIQTAKNSETVFATLASQADNRRQSVQGVSTDEELVIIMQHQQSYTAAARLVNVVDEMAQTILGLIR